MHLVLKSNFLIPYLVTMKNLSKVVTGLLLVVLFATLAATTFQLPVVPTVLVSVLISAFIPQPKNALHGVVLEQWAAYIIERFWKDNGFLKNAYDDSQYVIGGRIIHIPQPGSKPNVAKNRNSFPGTAVRRSDTDVVYPLDEYSTDPTHIPNIDAIHLSYNKQDSVLGDHMYVLNETVADDMLLKWAANATIVKTTGANATATPTQVGPVTGQSGNRLAFTQRDLKSLMTRMNANNVPKNDRFVLIDDNMFDAFYDSLGDTTAKDFSRYMDAENGIIGKLHGFNIMTRSSVLALTSADAVKALGAALGTTDNLGSIAWQKNAVAFAIGSTQLFQDTNNPLYYGDIHSALVMAGGRVRRADGLGVYIIEQGAAS